MAASGYCPFAEHCYWPHCEATGFVVYSAKPLARNGPVSEAESPASCAVHGAERIDLAVQRSGSSQESRIDKSAWECLEQVIHQSLASTETGLWLEDVRHTVQLVAIEMLRTRITLAAALMCTFKLPIRVHLAGPLAFARRAVRSQGVGLHGLFLIARFLSLVVELLI